MALQYPRLTKQWLQTDMGGETAHLSVEAGGKAVMNITNSAEKNDNGAFKNIYQPGWEVYDGKDIPF